MPAYDIGGFLPTLGLGVFFAWFTLTGFVSPLIQLGSMAVPGAIAPGSCMLVGMLLGAAYVRALALHMPGALFRLTAILPCCICACAAPLASFAEMPLGTPWYLTAFGFLVSGSAAALLFASWHGIVGRSANGRYLSREALACALGLLACTPIVLMASGPALPLAQITLGILNAALLAFAVKRAGASAPSPKPAHALQHVAGHLDKRFRVLFFILNFVFGLSWSMAEARPSALASSLGIACIALVAVCIAMRRQAEVQDGYVVVLMRLCLTSTTLAFLLKATGFVGASLVAQCLFTCSWAACWVVDISLLMQQARTFGISLAVHSATSMLINNAGLLTGWLAGATCMCSGLAHGSFASSALVLLAAALASCGAWLMPLDSHDSPDRIIARQAESARQRAAAKDAASGQFSGLEKAAKVYDLTERENDVLVLLLQGYTAKAISKRMNVSESTVKTHSYHIYRKTDVHSQQELIDLIEEL